MAVFATRLSSTNTFTGPARSAYALAFRTRAWTNTPVLLRGTHTCVSSAASSSRAMGSRWGLPSLAMHVLSRRRYVAATGLRSTIEMGSSRTAVPFVPSVVVVVVVFVVAAVVAVVVVG